MSLFGYTPFSDFSAKYQIADHTPKSHWIPHWDPHCPLGYDWYHILYPNPINIHIIDPFIPFIWSHWFHQYSHGPSTPHVPRTAKFRHWRSCWRKLTGSLDWTASLPKWCIWDTGTNTFFQIGMVWNTYNYYISLYIYITIVSKHFYLEWAEWDDWF